MKLRFLAAAVFAVFATAQTADADIILETLDFEAGVGVGYSTNIAEFTDSGTDYFLNTDGSDYSAAVVYNGAQGSRFFAGQDIDGEGASLPASLTWSGIDISGSSGLSLTLAAAEDDDGTNQDWDDSDNFEVFASIDGGTFTKIFAIANDGSQFNSAAFVDTDLDGVGDGTEITDTFQDLTASISGTGSTLTLRFDFNLNSGDEDLAIDNLRVTAVPEPSSFGVLALAGLAFLRRKRS